MRNVLPLLALLQLTLTANCYGERVEWIRQFGGSYSDLVDSIAIDSGGEVVVAGYSATLGNTSSFPSTAAYVARFDAEGMMQVIGTVATPRALPIPGSYDVMVAAGSADSIYLGGNRLDQSASSLITKMDADGEREWTSTYNFPAKLIYSLSSDANSNAVVSGKTELQDTHRSTAFVEKFDPAGALLWSNTIERETFQPISGVDTAASSSGDIHIATSILRPMLDGHDLNLAKFNEAGEGMWELDMPMLGAVDHKVAVDPFGDIFVAGTAGLDIGGVHHGRLDYYLSKFDSNGTLLWSRQYGSPDDDAALDIEVDHRGNIFIAGRTNGDLDGENAGLSDSFVSKIAPDGTLLWTWQFGTENVDVLNSLITDGSGNVYAAGYTTGMLGDQHYGSFDGVLIKFTVPEPASAMLLAFAGLAAALRRRAG